MPSPATAGEFDQAALRFGQNQQEDRFGLVVLVLTLVAVLFLLLGIHIVGRA